MNHEDALIPRRRFLTSTLSRFGGALALGALVVTGGCSDDKGPGMIDNPEDTVKTPDAQDSMKAAREQLQKRGAMGPPKKK